MDFSQISVQIAQQDVVEWAGLITGILYVILATYERSSCWIFGMISSGCIAWKSFTDYFLVADGILQLFYIVISIVGLINWLRGRTVEHEKPIITTPLLKHFIAVVLCLLISWPASWVLVTYASARYGYLDTALTMLSVWGTILLVRKDLHNWVYWIVVDTIFIGLYWQSGGYLFAILFFVYAVISIWGLKKWQASLRLQKPI